MGIRQVLERTPVFSGVEPEQLARLAAAGVSRSYERAAALWCAGDMPRAFTVVQSGLIKVVRPAPRGRFSICGLFGAPDTVGDLAALRDIPYPASAIAVTQTVVVISIPREVALVAFRKSEQLALNMIGSVNEKVSMLHDKIDVLSAGAVEARLATLLLKLYTKFGDDFDDGCSRVSVALSRQELADLVSTTFETAIRIMTRWEREGIVSTDPNGFTVLNLEVLRQASGEAASTRRSKSNEPCATGCR